MVNRWFIGWAGGWLFGLAVGWLGWQLVGWLVGGWMKGWRVCMVGGSPERRKGV